VDVQPAVVRQPAVHVDEAARSGTEAVVRDDEGHGVWPGGLPKLADGDVEIPVDRAGVARDFLDHCGSHLGRPGAGEVLPEKVLYPVGLVEDHRKEVAGPLLHEPQRGLQPPLTEPAQPGEVVERLGAVIRVARDQLRRWLERNHVVLPEERAELGRVDNVLGAWR